MNRPLVSVVLAYASGLLLAQIFPAPPAVLFAVSFALLGLAFASGKLRPHLLWPLLALLGWTNFTVRTAVIAPDDLRTRLGNEPALATVRGKLAETPRLKIIERDGGENWRSAARVRVSEIRIQKNRPRTNERFHETAGFVR
jgi:hypothetical protein